MIDEGAERAVVENGKSLCRKGALRTDGHFTSGDCGDEERFGTVVARGIANYSSSEMDRIKGLKSLDIEKELGYKYTEEVVHRDNMVVI